MALKPLTELFGDRSDLNTKMTPVEEMVAEILATFNIKIVSIARAESAEEKIKKKTDFAEEMAEKLLGSCTEYKEFRGKGENAESDAMHMMALANVSHNVLTELESNVDDFLSNPSIEKFNSGIAMATAVNQQVLLCGFKALPIHTSNKIQSELTEKGYIVQNDFVSFLEGVELVRATMDLQNETPRLQ